MLPQLEKPLSWLKSYGAYVLILILLLVIGFQAARLDAQIKKLQEAQNAALIQMGAKLGAVQGQLESSSKLNDEMSAELKNVIQQLGAVTTQHQTSTSTVSETTTLEPQGPVSPGTITGIWSDAHKRFTFSLPTAEFDSNQRFRYEAAVVTSADGSTKLLKDTFYELDPATGEVIPEAKTRLETHFSFSKEPGSVTPMLHLRLIGGIDQTASPIIGAEIFNLESLTTPVLRNLQFGVMGGYDNRNSVGFFGGALEYRIFGNVSIGGYYSVDTHGAPRPGALLTVELTR